MKRDAVLPVFNVKVGRKVEYEFPDARTAALRGLEMAMEQDRRCHELFKGKTQDAKIRIIFGAEQFEEFFGDKNG